MSDYDVFMKKYRKEHGACPKCGATSHSTTLAGYILDMSNKEAYKDLNACECYECGDRHTAHDRVPITMPCLMCDKPIEWIRHTQFAGSHPFCDEHARMEKDFGKNDDNYWENLDEI